MAAAAAAAVAEPKTKYDRQLRIWGDQGQAALEKASICLLNCGPTGTEALKNLVLGGIGSVTVVDGSKVELADLGNNFLLDEGCLGQSRAKSICSFLQELNDAVKAKYVEESPATMIDTNPSFFSQFTVVIATQLPESSLLKLDGICRSANIVLVAARSYGLTGLVRVSIKEHCVIESKPDHFLDDLRLHKPWTELKQFAKSIDICDKDAVVHKHTPYIVILVRLAEKWADAHDGQLPSTRQEKREFKDLIRAHMLNVDEDNYKEAVESSYKVSVAPGISNDIHQIIDDASSEVNLSSSDFWVLVAALKEFIANEGNGELPLEGTIPDMTSLTDDDEVDDSNAPVSVEGCLALYTEPELLSESWHCEHCSIAMVDPNINELKEGEEMAASDRKDSVEMMASGDEKKDDDKVTVSCSKKEDIDEITATCSNNVNSDMCCNEGVHTNPLLVDAENTPDGNCPNTGNTTLMEKFEVFAIDTTEQPDSKTNHQECKDLNSSAVESTSSSKQLHDSAQHKDVHNVDVATEETSSAVGCGDNDSAQHKDVHNVDVATEETSSAVSCGDNDSASCSTNSYKKVESGANDEEAVTSLPSWTQSILPSPKDNDDGFTMNVGRRKRTKMVGKTNKGKENQNKQKVDKTKVFRAAMRRILISKAPPVLTITLNRFSHDSNGRFRKLKGHVCFKETLDIRPFMDPRSKENDSTTYRLVAVVEHMGSMTCGHYVAYVRSGKIGGRQQQSRATKSWFYASDSQVRETSLQEVLNCEAYILFLREGSRSR